MSNIIFQPDKTFTTQAIPIISDIAKKHKCTKEAVIRNIIMKRLKYTEKPHQSAWLAANARQEIEYGKKHPETSMKITMDDSLVNVLHKNTIDRHEVNKLIRKMVYEEYGLK